MADHDKPIEIQGTVCCVRSLSKRIVFFDVCLIGEDDDDGSGGACNGEGDAGVAASASAAPAAADDARPPPTPTPQPAAHAERWVEVMAKSTVFDRVQEARDTIRVGDVVRFVGPVEDNDGAPLLVCRGFDIVTRWRDVGGGRSFAPRVPPPAHLPKSKAKGGKRPALLPSSQQQQQQQQQQQPEQQQQPGQASTGACKFFVNTGRCLKGDACPFAHPADGRGAALASWVARRRAERRAAAQREGCCHVAGAKSKRHRARVYARWLVDTFGADALNAGGGVVDVAGGRGALTFELTVTHGIKCTLVEPRALRLDRAQHRLLRERGLEADIIVLTPPPTDGGDGDAAGVSAATNGSSNAAAAAAGEAAAAAVEAQGDDGGGSDSEEQWWRTQDDDDEDDDGDDDEGGDDGKQGQQPPAKTAAEAEAAAEAALPWLAAMRGRTGAPAAEAALADQQRQQQQQQQVEKDKEQEQTQKQQQQEGDDSARPRQKIRLRQVRALFSPALLASDWWRAAVAGGGGGGGSSSSAMPSCVVGLHPDEATDLIVDAGLALRRPWAVAPCCVFPRRFAWRRLRSGGGDSGDAGDGGRPVVTYLDLVEYLVQKGAPAGASEDALAFEGCNRVVWARGDGGS